MGDRDKQVFNELRRVYNETRGRWRAIMSLHTLAEIRYVKVQINSSQVSWIRLNRRPF